MRTTERRRSERPPKSRPGLAGHGIDGAGQPVIDPTENVRELFEAGATRQDDLRLAERRLQEEKIQRVEQGLKAVRREVRMRANHQRDLFVLEAKRLDAVRSVDQLAVKTEADRSAAAITALANAAATTAETLRSAVNTSATNLATQLDRTVTAITERIAALEKGSYTSMGKQAVADPMMEQLINEMRNLTSQRAQDAGKSAVRDPALAEMLLAVRNLQQTSAGSDGRDAGAAASRQMMSWVLGIILALITIGAFVFTRPQAQAAAPQIIYTPAPPGTQLPSTPPSTVPR